jgi:rod shape-determining protein MreB and related proteins
MNVLKNTSSRLDFLRDNIYQNFASIFSKEALLINVGSVNTKIYLDKKELFFEPTCLAIHKTSGSVLAIGKKAYDLLGKVPDSVEISFPVANGVVAHPTNLELFLTAVKNKIHPKSFINKMIFGWDASVIVPTSISPAKKNLYKKVLKNAGFNRVTFFDSSSLSARNAMGSTFDKSEICVLDIGGQKTEISVFSLGELIKTKSFNWGGVFFTESLQKIVRHKHLCVIGWHLAEATKLQIASLIKNKEKLAVRGKGLSTQASKTVVLSSSDFHEDFLAISENFLDRIQQFLSLLPSETAVSILEKGILITGGASQLEGLSEAISNRFQCEVLVSKNPQTDAITALGEL